MFALFENILNWFKKLFGITPKKSSNEQTDENLYVEQYKNTFDTINLTAIVALKLTNIIGAEAKIEVKPKNSTADGEDTQTYMRIDFLNTSLQRVIDKFNIIIARSLGTGGVVLKPYMYNWQIYADILPQNRFFVVERAGEVIVKAGFIADYIKKNNVEYTRIEYHTLDENGVYVIENKAIKGVVGDFGGGEEIPLNNIPEWAQILPIMTISGVDKMLFAFLKCPVDNRKTELNSSDVIYGVPITYGQNKLIKMIVDILNEIPDEYKNKKTFIGADELLFSEKNKLPSGGLYKLFRSGGGIDKQSFWEIFSPDIRQTSYFEGVNNLLGLLEKAIGVNRGLLTDLATKDATARAIEQSSFDTEALADAMHKNIETALRQLIYAFNVYANAFTLSPGKTNENNYQVIFDWMSWSERSSDRFNQLLQGIAAGAVNVFELRKYLFDENDETAMANLPEQIDDNFLLVGEQ